ncbi:hypothetical protein FK530_22930 [Tsukamurella conjunctivitidis]|uniref:DUF1376 domain-containing protein n=1 Tax=Tsukamurella conjunctivitidis TaxID=2592068 RepID=A0A5C5RR96_9ACTN|nr:hypothetical protein [Tsukamurella conjunctivitidis]TWS25576.1 hypothetical protein FK530_22930 [Tsukamurella conjunctivitidis]
MPWFAVDDQFAFHAKAITAGNEALGMWVRAGSWCQQQGGTGVVPEGIVAALGGIDLAEKLVRAGLWARTPSGFKFHEWDEYQKLNSAARNRSAKRAEAGRMGGLKSGEARRAKAANRTESVKQTAKQTPKQPLKQTPFCFEAKTSPDLQESKQTKQNGNPLPNTLTHRVALGEGVTLATARVCPRHPDGNPTGEACGGCADARRAVAADAAEALEAAKRARSAEVREQAAGKLAAIADCGLCDDNGYRGTVVCDHIDHAPAAARGRAKIQAELDAIAARKSA